MVCLCCLRNFPEELLSVVVSSEGRDVMCPLCALKRRNEMHGLPPETPFQGQIAAAMHRQALAHLKKTGQK